MAAWSPGVPYLSLRHACPDLRLVRQYLHYLRVRGLECCLESPTSASRKHSPPKLFSKRYHAGNHSNHMRRGWYLLVSAFGRGPTASKNLLPGRLVSLGLSCGIQHDPYLLGALPRTQDSAQDEFCNACAGDLCGQGKVGNGCILCDGCGTGAEEYMADNLGLDC